MLGLKKRPHPDDWMGPFFEGEFWFLLRSLSKPGILNSLAHPTPATGGGEHMAILIAFLVSVAAGITCHYICKWLDRRKKK